MEETNDLNRNRVSVLSMEDNTDVPPGKDDRPFNKVRLKSKFIK